MLDTEKLYTEYKVRLIGLFKKWGCSNQDAEDLTGDVFLAIMESDTFEGRCSEWTWLSRIARYKYLTHRYKEAQRKRLAAKLHDKQEYTHVLDILELDDMMDKLSDKLRSTLKLQLQGFTRHEICDILEIQDEACKSRLALAKKQLQEMGNEGSPECDRD